MRDFIPLPADMDLPPLSLRVLEAIQVLNQNLDCRASTLAMTEKMIIQKIRVGLLSQTGPDLKSNIRIGIAREVRPAIIEITGEFSLPDFALQG